MEVWLLTIVGQGGVKATVHAARKDADQVLLKYVEDNWGDYLDEDIPDDSDVAIDYFFEALDDTEYYSLHHDLLPDPEVPPASDEVALDEDELKILSASLDYVPYVDVADDLGWNRKHVAEVLMRIRDRLRE